MFTEDKVTEIFCMADDFCKFFDSMMAKYTIPTPKKHKYHRSGTLSKAEVMVIMILFHGSCYRCLKHFYLEHVTKHLRHLFPQLVSYNRFVELEKEVAIPLALFIKKVLLGWDALASVSLTVLRSGYAETNVFIFIEPSGALRNAASALWAGFSASNCILSVTRWENCSIS